jgi:hypothetical protein
VQEPVQREAEARRSVVAGGASREVDPVASVGAGWAPAIALLRGKVAVEVRRAA